MWRSGSQLSGASAPSWPRHSGCDRVVPVAAPCAPGFGLRSGPVRNLRGNGVGHTSLRPGPWSPAPAETRAAREGPAGPRVVSAGSPGARLCARAGRGRSVTRRARRIPDSRPPLRPPRTFAHRSPGSSRRRTVSTCVRSPASPVSHLHSFFFFSFSSDLGSWVVVFIIIPKDSVTSLSALPASCLVALSKLTIQAPGAGEGSLSRPRCCSLSRRTAFCLGFPLWSSRFGSFPRTPLPSFGSRVWSPPSTRENPARTPDPQRGEDPLGSGRSLHCMRAGHTCRFRGTKKTSSFPRTAAPPPPPLPQPA